MAKLIFTGSPTHTLKNDISADSIIACQASFEISNAFSYNEKVKIDPGTGYARVETVLFAPGELLYRESDVKDPRYAGWHTIEASELKKTEFLFALKALDIVIRHQDIDVQSYGDEIIPDGQIAEAWWDENDPEHPGGVVKGIIVIKDKDAIKKVENRELWGGSLQYDSQFKLVDDKIYQTNLSPHHWALTNVPRDDRVKLNNEKTGSSEMTPEEKAAKEAEEQQKLKLKNEDDDPKSMVKNMAEGFEAIQNTMKNMGDNLATLSESVASMAPESGLGPSSAPAGDAVMEILLNSYAVKNNICSEEIKNAIDEGGIDTAINTYETAMGIAKNMAGGEESEEEKAAKKEAEKVANEEAEKIANEEKAAKAAEEKEKDVSDTVANEASHKDFTSQLL